MTIVTHHANHFIGIGPALVVENQVTSNRVLSAPRVSRELLIDDHHTGRVGVITVRELASGNQGKAQRPEVSRCRHPNAGLRHRLAFRAGMLRPVRPSEVGADRAHRQGRDGCHGLESREPREVNRARGGSNRSSARCVRYRAASGVMRKTRRLLVSKPTSTRRNSANVRANNPAPTSNITAAAISATTSPARSRPDALAETAAPSLSAPAIGVRLARKVGTAFPTAVTSEREDGGERRDSCVHGHFVQARNAGGRDRQGRVHPPRREHEGDDHRDDRAQQRFRRSTVA